jgi:hypothetical protein
MYVRVRNWVRKRNHLGASLSYAYTYEAVGLRRERVA